MTVAIDVGSAAITVTTRPSVKTPTISGSQAMFEGTEIEAIGNVRLFGTAGDNPNGWTLGFIQVQWIETNWAIYHGEKTNDGSLQLQMGKPPARPAQGCRDHPNGVQTDVFYNNAGNEVASAGAAFPVELDADFYDKPWNAINLVEPNSLTGKSNFLREAQLEFHFCTTLAVRDAAGAFHQLASFYWNMHWQATFKLHNYAAPLTPGSWAIYPNKSGTSSTVSRIILGKVIDPKFQNLVTAISAPVCNTVFKAAVASVATPSTGTAKTGRQEKRTIEEFDVRR